MHKLKEKMQIFRFYSDDFIIHLFDVNEIQIITMLNMCLIPIVVTLIFFANLILQFFVNVFVK